MQMLCWLEKKKKNSLFEVESEIFRNYIYNMQNIESTLNGYDEIATL